MFQVARDLRRVFKEDGMEAGPFLWKFWKDCIQVQAMLESVVSRLLRFVRDCDVPRTTERGRWDRSRGVRRQRGPDELGLAPKEKKAKRFQGGEKG